MSEKPLLDIQSTSFGTGIPTRLQAFQHGMEVTTLRPPRRVNQWVRYAQIAQVVVVRKLFFAELVIETRGGGAVRIAGLLKDHAEEARAFIWEHLAAA